MLEWPVRERDHTQGLQSALVTLVEYGDYESPHCGQVHAFLQEIQQQWGDRLRFVFRHFAMTGIHPHAQHAAEAVEAAGAQGKFWEMHDIVFKHQGALGNGFLVEYANTLGLDMTRFLREMAAHTHVDRVREDLNEGIRNGVEATPTFFLNGVQPDNGWNEGALREAIEAAASSPQENDSLPPS